jgi:hypothetical protein
MERARNLDSLAYARCSDRSVTPDQPADSAKRIGSSGFCLFHARPSTGTIGSMETETRTDERRQDVAGVDEEHCPATRESRSQHHCIVRVQPRASRRLVSVLLAAVVSIAGSLAPLGAVAAERPDSKIFGVRLRLGWKYDDVRM